MRRKSYRRGRRGGYGLRKNFKRSFRRSKRRARPQYVKVSRGGIRL